MLHQMEEMARRAGKTLDFETPLKTIVTKVSSAEISRRSLLQGLGGFVLAVSVLPGDAKALTAYPTAGAGMPHATVSDPHVFVAIAPDGQVTIIAHRSEMGTGSRTTLPMIIADEMEADWDRVTIQQAPGDEPRYGNQNTDGSRSLRHFIQPMREIGAAMRHMLVHAAAAKWGADPADLQAVNHEVVHTTLGVRYGYGDLAEDAMALPTPARDELTFKTEDEFRYIGKGSVQITDLHDITTGKATYGADVQLDGMKFAVIARSPVVGAAVVSVDDSAAMAIAGVEQIVQIPVTGLGSVFKPLGGVAVIANSTWAAIQGRDALKIEWDMGEHASFSTPEYHKELSASANAPGSAVRKQGDPDGALASAAKVLSFEYYQPHLAHSPMEPPAATARMTDGHMEIWAPVQSPYVARTDTAAYLGMEPDDVTMNVTLLGGGFGRKSKADFATEAAFLAKETGLPIRVQWTREDDIRHSYYHTTSVEKIDVGLDADNNVTVWRHRSAAPSFLSTFAPDSGVQHEIEIGMGLENLPYDLPNIGAEQCKAFAHTRVGWYRSVSNIPRAFAVQSATAEIAAELGKDQKDFLLEMLGPDRILDPETAGLTTGKYWNQYEPYDEFPFETGRLRTVIEMAAAKAGWGKDLPEGEALGIAAHRSFVTYVATVVRVKMVNGVPTVPEVHVAVDAGFIANPERVRSQMQGACVFGMTAAMYSGIVFENGEVQNSNFNDYEMTRSDNFPMAVHAHIVDHPFAVHATGIGEPGVPPFIPALTNAIFNATGQRIRNLPIGDQLA